MMKKTLAAVLTCCGLLCCPAVSYAGISAEAYILMDASTGTVLEAKSEHEQLPMASTTKIMTAILTLEAGDLDTPFTAPEEPLLVEGSSMGLLPGDEVTLLDLCYGMLLPSGNEAANLAAWRVAGSQEAFVERMNQKAAELSLADTQFQNPSGLPADGHYSSAADLATLACYALQNETFAEICATESQKLTYGNPPYDRWLTNHNKLLGYYEYCIGVKTGYTKAAGRCLVSAARKDGVTLVAVTLNDPNDWSDHQALYESGFAQGETLLEAGETFSCPLVGGTEDTILLEAADTLRSYSSEEAKLVVLAEPFYYAPMTEGTVLGTAELWEGDTLVASTDLVAAPSLDSSSS